MLSINNVFRLYCFSSRKTLEERDKIYEQMSEYLQLKNVIERIKVETPQVVTTAQYLITFTNMQLIHVFIHYNHSPRVRFYKDKLQYSLNYFTLFGK